MKRGRFFTLRREKALALLWPYSVGIDFIFSAEFLLSNENENENENMVDFGTFWTDCRETSHHTVTLLRSVVMNFEFNVRKNAQYT